MNKSIEIMALALGGLSLFLVAFLGFASLSGAPLNELPVMGGMFGGPDEPGPAESPDPVPGPAPEGEHKTAAELFSSNAGILSRYTLSSPFDDQELDRLVGELKLSKLDYEKRLRELDERETSLIEREAALTEQLDELLQIRSSLEDFQDELSLRADEIDRDFQSAVEAGEESWAVRANLFAEGDVGELVERLTQYEPGEVARMLHLLDPQRATELLNAIEGPDWKQYVDAYSAYR